MGLFSRAVSTPCGEDMERAKPAAGRPSTGFKCDSSLSPDIPSPQSPSDTHASVLAMSRKND